MTQPPFEPRLSDVGPEDEVSLLLSDARTRAQTIIDESIERAQELLRGEPAPQAFERLRLRRTVNDMAVDVRAIHSRLDEIEALIRGVGVASRAPGYPPPSPAPPTSVVPPGYAPAPVYYAPAPMPTPPVAPVPAPFYAPQPEAPAPPAQPAYEAPIAPPPAPAPAYVPPVEVAAAPPPPLPPPPPMEPTPAPVALPAPAPVAPAPEPMRSEAPPASAIPPQRPAPPEPVAPPPPVAITPPTPVAPPPAPIAPRFEEPAAPPPPPMAAAPVPTPAAPEPQLEPAATEGFDPEGGSIALRVSPVAGFQGLMRVQDALGRCRGVREAGVEAYAQGEARLRLHLSDRLSGEQLAKALGEILGRGARVASESVSERTIQLALE